MILAWIMKECMSEYSQCTVDEIAENYIEGTPRISETPVHRDEVSASAITGINTEDSSISEGTVMYDILFNAIAPASGELIELIINIEAQSNFYPGYPLIKRMIYYCSRMISAQYGTVFEHSRYDKIRKAYSIWICTNPPQERIGAITRYSIQEEHILGSSSEMKSNYDLMTAIIINLGDRSIKSAGRITGLLEVLLSAKMKPDEKKKILNKEYDIAITENMEREVSDMCNISMGILEEGIEKGRSEGMLGAVRSLMDTMKLSARQAMAALKIPEDEYGKYEQMIEQLSSKH